MPLTSNEGNAHRAGRALEELNVYGVAAAIRPVLLVDREAWLLAAVVQVRRDVDFDTCLLGEARGLGVAAGNQDAPIGKQLSAAGQYSVSAQLIPRPSRTVDSEW